MDPNRASAVGAGQPTAFDREKTDRAAGQFSSMDATPNNAPQRTRAAVSLQSVPGELSTSGRRRAPLSLGPFGVAEAAHDD